MNKRNSISYIGREHLHPHPDNPRKDLGALDELRESIRENGIMQNLTVIPQRGLVDSGEYTILIGYRRFAASEGILDELPCVVVDDLTDREQVGIMLCENLQRNDLTYYEQAQGFQMMMNLGDSVDEISEKTGFSKSTVKHRLEIAKLSKSTIERDRSWQLTISDLIELEKVDNVKERDRILKEAFDSNNLRNRIRQSMRDKCIQKNLSTLLSWIKPYKIKELPANVSYWSSGYETVYDTDISEANPKKITKEKVTAIAEKYKNLGYKNTYGHFYLLNKVDKEKKKKTEAEKREEAKMNEKKMINKVHEAACQAYYTFIKDLDSKAGTALSNVIAISNIWNMLFEMEATLSSYIAADLIHDVKERKAFYSETLPGWPASMQMFFILTANMTGMEILDWSGTIQKDTLRYHDFVIRSLEKFGFNLPEDIDETIIDGTSELYKNWKQESDEDEEDDED